MDDTVPYEGYSDAKNHSETLNKTLHHAMLDHQGFAQHNKFGTFPVPKNMNNSKKSVADAAAVATKIAAKVMAKKAAKQAAAGQAEVEQQAKQAVAVADKATKKEATKEATKQMMSAEDAALAKATKIFRRHSKPKSSPMMLRLIVLASALALGTAAPSTLLSSAFGKYSGSEAKATSRTLRGPLRASSANLSTVARRLKKHAALYRAPFLQIIVLAKERPASLQRVLDSIQATDAGIGAVSVDIRIAGDHAETNSVANAWAWPHKTVTRTQAGGLRAAWLGAWSKPSGHAIILEDDVELSPAWYGWLTNAWKAYEDRDDVAGISLQRQTLIPQQPSKKMEIVNDHHPFLYKLVGSIGFSPHPQRWQEFLEWVQTKDSDTFDAHVEGLVTSVWYKRSNKKSMWTQLFLRFCDERGLYTLYANLPEKKTLAAHWREKDEQFAGGQGRDFTLATAVKGEFPTELIKYGWNGMLQKHLQDIPKKSDGLSKIAVAIPTYNRAGYVQLCAQALNNTLDADAIWVFDDLSSEYTVYTLKKWFHTKNVHRNTKRRKPDKQGRAIVEWFLTTDYDWPVTLDSDLIVRPDWLQVLRGMLPQTQGVLSLYHSSNTNHHPTLTCGNSLCEMQSLGNGGIVWSRELAQKMLANMTNKNVYDWGWKKWLETEKIKQYAAEKSLVLHVGMHGTWGADSKRETSVGFEMNKLSAAVQKRAEFFLEGGSPRSLGSRCSDRGRCRPSLSERGPPFSCPRRSHRLHRLHRYRLHRGYSPGPYQGGWRHKD